MLEDMLFQILFRILLLCTPLAMIIAAWVGLNWRLNLARRKWRAIECALCLLAPVLFNGILVLACFYARTDMLSPAMNALEHAGLPGRTAIAITDSVVPTAFIIGTMAILFWALRSALAPIKRVVYGLLFIWPLMFVGVAQILLDQNDPCTYTARGAGDCSPD